MSILSKEARLTSIAVSNLVRDALRTRLYGCHRCKNLDALQRGRVGKCSHCRDFRRERTLITLPVEAFDCVKNASDETIGKIAALVERHGEYGAAAKCGKSRTFVHYCKQAVNVLRDHGLWDVTSR